MFSQHASTGQEARYYENAFKIMNDYKAIMISTIGKPETLLKANEGCNCRIVTNFSAVTFDHDTLDYKVNPNKRQLVIEYQTGLKESRDNRLKITKQNVSVIKGSS
ncbi:hypothetical protein NB640_04520 [Oxalobacter vibrioformis]|uniref:Uncharacterized protein n=1 Tax=Oxalobacter vibrioformis TaxID=933080 RepID=A0A9E9LW94_9BURK|nr:hypothetical protein [Oxalobacter vibrioformis]WAW10910.1 hypothetical protein NB640_04520 [Oxalobacter vibrioformis]